ncbi:coiled-coil domain-containing protein 137 [Carex littledalei]|uniref:Coiled-coil domain-containing protein 137 n=1 Tax=Carex littledalei TaxID=544730 RepID=A0A833QS78_9POAL|nr:coiled-coil domain-containing protein 137 [Carex littledalei]
MGGKGRRRREKNYVASHGGEARLPPPPKVRELEALPSKLRLLMKFKNASSDKIPDGQERERDERSEKKKQKAAVGNAKENNPKKTGPKTGAIEKSKLSKEEILDANINSDSDDVREKKKKRKAPKDLRFENLAAAATNTRKKKRKEYLDAKKKKHKKEDEEEILNFPGREQIKFGDVVQAPPKLTVPKMPKSWMDASKERLRLQAIDEYRNRKSWTSRPGIHLPTPDAPTL